MDWQDTVRSRAFRIAVSTALIGACFAARHAQRVPSSSKIFIAAMENGLDGFIAPEIIKQRLPIHVVTQESDADYVLAGGSLKADDHWYNTVFGGKDKNEGNVRLLDVKNKEMIWAGEAERSISLWIGREPP